MDSTSDDRRRAERHPVYIGAEIEVDGGRTRSALTEDASATGLLLLTRARLQDGQTVRLRVFLPGVTEGQMVMGRVVRRETLSLEESALWREKVAIALDESFPELAAKFQELADQQAAVLGPRK